MKKWLAGLFAVLLLLGACGDEDGSDGDDAPQGAPTTEPSPVGDEADGDAAARAEREKAKKRAKARAARREARERRARARRARARREAAAAAAAAEREAAEREAAEQQAAEEEAASQCDPNYEGACLDPNSADYDCEGGSGDGPDYVGTVRVVGDDIHDLDRDGDGVACDT